MISSSSFALLEFIIITRQTTMIKPIVVSVMDLLIMMKLEVLHDNQITMSRMWNEIQR